MSRCKVEAPYPEPADGKKRVIFFLDPAESRTAEAMNYRVQLLPGRSMTLSKTDAANITALPGEIKERTVEGWGFDYYDVKISNEAIATRMLLLDDDDGVPVRKFVPIASPKLIRYNSNAPVVVYLPEDAELRYSVWTAGEEAVAVRE